MNRLHYVLQEDEIIPDGYKVLSFKMIPQGDNPEETRRDLRMAKAIAIQNGQDIIFRKSETDYEVYVRG